MLRQTHNYFDRKTLRVFLLCLWLLPLLMGGCPEFRDSLVNVADSLTRGLIFGTDTRDNLVVTARDGVINAFLDLFFDQLRGS